MNCYSEKGTLSSHCLETVIQTIAEGILVCDTDLIIRFSNNSMLTLTGYSSSELYGREYRNIVICSAESQIMTPADRQECTIRRKNGHTLTVLINSRPIMDEKQNIIGIVLSFQDISELKLTQHRLSNMQIVSKKNDGFEGIIGKSRKMQEVFELIDLAAASNATVLISGETGTGKELAARAIHARSLRREAPFITVNCSALPENLLESELFGHAKGAFTGAIRDKTGRFELADGGTLFLDEIGEISPLIHVKLLRFLQQREFERVGESTTRKADIRIIAATNRNLRSMTDSGEFRDDLYYRLKVFPIQLPPLREHKEDTGLLVSHFIDKFNSETGKQLTGLSHDAAITLMDYCWPGNIRELENAIEHAFVTCREGEIDLFDLPIDIRRVEMRRGLCLSGPEQNAKNDGYMSPAQTVAKHLIDRETLISAIQAANGSKAAAARTLGINRTTLWRKIKSFGISA
jgi:PAS domain S-box-containing protein